MPHVRFYAGTELVSVALNGSEREQITEAVVEAAAPVLQAAIAEATEGICQVVGSRIAEEAGEDEQGATEADVAAVAERVKAGLVRGALRSMLSGTKRELRRDIVV
jgi:hypothetical protein